jgi:hypothetical protein
MVPDKRIFDALLLSADKDAAGLKECSEALIKFSGCKKVIIAAPSASRVLIENMKNSRVEFVDEERIYEGLSKNSIRDVFSARGIDVSAPGWYLQQFIKIAYALKSSDECFLIWDSDTFMLRKTGFFSDNGRILLDNSRIWKNEAFERANRQLIGTGKKYDFTYINEHMMIKASCVAELIKFIESRKDIPGRNFWEKIIYAIDADAVVSGGFSEFELIGTWMDIKHRDEIEYRPLSSIRNIGMHLGGKLNHIDKAVLARKYDFVTLEKKRADNAGFIKAAKGKIKNLVKFVIGR